MGDLLVCYGPTSETAPVSFYGQGHLDNLPFSGAGACVVSKARFPVPETTTIRCFLELGGLPERYVGGLLTTNTLIPVSPGPDFTGTVPGYTSASIATIRLRKKH